MSRFEEYSDSEKEVFRPLKIGTFWKLRSEYIERSPGRANYLLVVGAEFPNPTDGTMMYVINEEGTKEEIIGYWLRRWYILYEHDC